MEPADSGMQSRPWQQSLRSVHATLAIPGMTPRLATIWAMQHGAAVPTRLADVTTVAGEAMTLVLPPMSASTVVVVP